MLKIFGQTDSSFASNGDIILQPLKAKVKKVDNGDYYLYIECGLEYSDYIVEDNIIVAETPQGEQAFRVSNVEKTKRKITTKAFHVFYDSENLLIADSFVVDKDCNDALSHLNNATDTTSPFSTYSDIETIDSYRCVRSSLYEAVQTVLERWGGHLVRDNFTIKVMASIGHDNGVTVRYKKNLKDISAVENWDLVVTKLLPVGKDGILLNALDPSASIYVYADISYNLPYTKTVSFDQNDINQEDYPTEQAYKQALIADLRSQAEAYVSAHKVPEVNYTLKAHLEKITDIGDVVEVIDERLGIDILASVISFEYDCLSERYTEIEFGNYQKTLSDLVSSINTDVTYQATVVSENIGQQLASDINNTLTGSYIVFNSDNILVLDRLPKESAVNVIKIDKNGISVSATGTSGTYHTVWGIDRSLDLDEMSVSHLSASAISKGTLKTNSTVTISIYSGSTKIGSIDNNGFIMNGGNSTIKINNSVGFSIYDAGDNRVFYLSSDEIQITKANIDALKINNSSVSDFITTQTTTSGWDISLTKLSHATVKSTQTISSPTYTSLMTGLYISTLAITLPRAFTNPLIFASVKSPANSWVGQVQKTDSTHISIDVVTTASSGDITLDIMVTE